MNPNMIDTITRLFADRKLSRRQTLAAGALAAPALPSVAQDATPIVLEATPVAPDADHGPEMLFVQSFQSGSIVPSERAEGRYTVTLDHGLGETIYFSDRPDRLVGSTPTAAFLDGLGFPEENPPNAAILTRNPNGDSNMAVVELFDPVYDAETATLTYDISVLEHWEDSTDLAFTQTPVDVGTIGETFGSAHLFIDDCADEDITCVTSNSDGLLGIIPNADFDGWCYSWWPAARCLPCQPWNRSFTSASEYWTGICRARFCPETWTCWAGTFR